MVTWRLLLVLLLFILMPGQASADMLYLKNGHQLEGLVRREVKGALEFQVEGGIVVFNQEEILRIERCGEAEAVRIQAKWEQSRQHNEKVQLQVEEQRKQEMDEWRMKKALEAEQRRAEEERQLRLGANARLVPLTADPEGHLFVEAVINDTVPVTMVMDTGAPMSLLTAEVARQLGFNLEQAANIGQVMVLNGNYDVTKVTLKSVALSTLKAESIEVYVLLKDDPEVTRTIKGGLLGMSFLSKFHFAVNRSKQELLLYKNDTAPESGTDSMLMPTEMRVFGAK